MSDVTQLNVKTFLLILVVNYSVVLGRTQTANYMSWCCAVCLLKIGKLLEHLSVVGSEYFNHFINY